MDVVDVVALVAVEVVVPGGDTLTAAHLQQHAILMFLLLHRSL